MVPATRQLVAREAFDMQMAGVSNFRNELDDLANAVHTKYGLNDNEPSIEAAQSLKIIFTQKQAQFGIDLTDGIKQTLLKLADQKPSLMSAIVAVIDRILAKHAKRAELMEMLFRNENVEGLLEAAVTEQKEVKLGLNEEDFRAQMATLKQSTERVASLCAPRFPTAFRTAGAQASIILPGGNVQTSDPRARVGAYTGTPVSLPRGKDHASATHATGSH